MKLAMLAALLALSSFVLAQAPEKAAGPQKKGDDEKKPAPAMSIEKSTKPPQCVIKPVMTDDELRACGARIPR